MIDIESAVYTAVHNDIKGAYPEADISSVYVELPAKFPHITIVEIDNATYGASATLDERENHTRLMYQIDVYSNKTDVAKGECRGIMKIADAKMLSLGFTRESMSQTPNIDRSLYRITARYTAVVSKGVTNGDNITHFIYKS